MSEYTEELNRAGVPVYRPREKAAGREERHQEALTNWARMMRGRHPELELYHHILNGGPRSKGAAAKLKGAEP